MVVDEEPLRHRHSANPGFIRTTCGSTEATGRHPRHRRSGERPALTWVSGEPFPHSIRGRGRRRRSSHGRRPYSGVSNPWSGDAQGFGAGPVLRHTVRVALSQVRLVGHTTGALAGASGPNLDRDDFFWRRRVCVRATHPSAGVGGPQTGKQRRHSQRNAPSADRTWIGPGEHGPIMGPLIVR